MSQSPSYFVNSPVSGTTYYAPAGYQFIPNSGNTWTATVKAWSGPNGTGSLVAVSSLTAINRDVTNGVDRNSFTASSANTANAASSNGTNGSSVFAAGGRYTGGAIGSLEIFGVYTGSAVVPSVSSFSPTVGGPGTSVTVSGNNFNGATGVTFNGTGASFSVTNNTTISATVPTGATTGPISASNPSGSGASAANFIPSTFRCDDGAAWQTANALWGDDGTNWQLCKLWADDGTTWNQIA